MNITPDTNAAVLLVGRFSGERFDDGAGPLTPVEYNRVAKRLHADGRRPSDLTGGHAHDILRTLADDGTVSEDRVRRLLARGPEIAIRLSQWSSSGIRVLGRGDADYPAGWKERLGAQRPPVLYCIGDPGHIDGNAVGVVGSRDVDDGGRRFAERVAKAAARDGLAVVSGFARGVDQYAMAAALAADGRAIGIVADSLLRNASKIACLDAIARGAMTLVSTCSPDITRFMAWRAMERNKYIYASARATIVVESAKGSGGTWSGAVEALEHGWGPVLVRAGGARSEGRAALAGRADGVIDEDALDQSNWYATQAKAKGPRGGGQTTLFGAG